MIYYLVGACKGLRRGYLSVTSIRKTRSEKPPRSSAFFLRMLLISSSVVPSCSARALISSITYVYRYDIIYYSKIVLSFYNINTIKRWH